MSKLRPLVLDPNAETPLQQIQGGTELDIPLEDRFQTLKQRFDCLVESLLTEGFELPDEVTGDNLWT